MNTEHNAIHLSMLNNDELTSLVHALPMTLMEAKASQPLSTEDKIRILNQAAANNTLPDCYAELSSFFTEAGMAALVDACNHHKRSELHQGIDDKALAVLIATQYPEIYQTAKAILVEYQISKWDYFKLVHPLKISPAYDKGLTAFRQKLITIATGEGFGKNHVIEPVLQNRKLFVHVSYPGYLKRESEINEDNQLVARPRRKVFSVTFQYDANTGVLQIHASSNHKAFLRQLRDVFVSAFLATPKKAQWFDGQIINLAPLSNPAFERQLRDTNPEITQCQIVNLTFAPSANPKERTQQRFAYTSCHDWMRNHEFDPTAHLITEVTFRFAFEGLGRPLNVTLKTTNNSIEINDHGYRATIITAQLRSWNLLND